MGNLDSVLFLLRQVKVWCRSGEAAIGGWESLGRRSPTFGCAAVLFVFRLWFVLVLVIVLS